MMKRCLSLLLACLLFALPALAQENTCRLPALSKLVEAKLTGYEEDEAAQCIYLTYSPATRGDVNYFWMLANACGAFPLDMELDPGEGMTGDYIIFPGTAYDGSAIFHEAGNVFILRLSFDTGVVDDSFVENFTAFMTQEIKLPAGAGKNTFPQFYACAGRQPFSSGQGSGYSYAFNDQAHWLENYNEIDASILRAYTNYMALFGFEVWVDTLLVTDDGRLDPVLLHYSNGDAEVILNYNAASGTAAVHYKPGVSYNLLGAGELLEALPQ